jgi:hypothetical protein
MLVPVKEEIMKGRKVPVSLKRETFEKAPTKKREDLPSFQESSSDRDLELGNRENGTLFLSLLTTGFNQLPLNALELVCANLPGLNRQLVTAFPSPTPTVRYRTTLVGSMFLACHFAVTPVCTADPFGFELLSSLSERGLSLLKTRCQRLKPSLLIRHSDLRFPLGLLHPAGS